jgi:hypothetical protein
VAHPIGSPSWVAYALRFLQRAGREQISRAWASSGVALTHLGDPVNQSLDSEKFQFIVSA